MGVDIKQVAGKKTAEFFRQLQLLGHIAGMFDAHIDELASQIDGIVASRICQESPPSSAPTGG